MTERQKAVLSIIVVTVIGGYLFCCGSDKPAETVKIASWNVLNLGKNTPVEERADVIGHYDIVALQEVESLEGLKHLRTEVENKTGIT